MSASAPAPQRHVNWPRRLALLGIAVVVALVVALILSAVVPREWAQTVGGQADGGLLSGSGLGLFYGFVFTLLPLLVLWLVVRLRPSVGWWVGGLVVALALAAPNLMTLSIVMGTGNAAHAGERILDVEAPGFRGGTLVGVLVAVAVTAFVVYTVQMRRRAGRRADRLEHEVRDMRRARDEDDAAGRG
ncbi:MAG: hypothetical protein KDC33_04135 [Thermoleophilia bacterium]|nr:hypothetical protein [Thermoleophilia bacterium]